jgi:SAM-dependent methyltransferase
VDDGLELAVTKQGAADISGRASRLDSCYPTAEDRLTASKGLKMLASDNGSPTPSPFDRMVGAFHSRAVFGRRSRKIVSELVSALPSGTVLDVGCGDGTIAAAVGAQRSDIRITGLDVLVRTDTKIPVAYFDGNVLPTGNKSVDTVMFIDVLHHTDDPMVLLREAVRVARTAIVIKDHLSDDVLAFPTLRFMDWVGNAHVGVRLPYNYWARERWSRAFAELGVRPVDWRGRLGLYPFPASLFFDRGLHFVARLALPAAQAANRER